MIPFELQVILVAIGSWVMVLILCCAIAFTIVQAKKEMENEPKKQ